MKPFGVDRYGDTEAVIAPDILRAIPKEDRRSFIVRLLDSIRISASFDRKSGSVTIEAHGKAEL
tara:strand:- start:358 stop:549 length:192 start_codon:yes stop_codon:yes gene_type:complete